MKRLALVVLLLLTACGDPALEQQLQTTPTSQVVTAPSTLTPPPILTNPWMKFYWDVNPQWPPNVYFNIKCGPTSTQGGMQYATVDSYYMIQDAINGVYLYDIFAMGWGIHYCVVTAFIQDPGEPWPGRESGPSNEVEVDYQSF